MNLSLVSSRRNRIFTYVIFWVFYFLLFWFIESSFNYDYFHVFLGDLVGLPLKIIFVILVLEWLMEQYLFKKNIVLFIGFLVPIILVFALAQRLLDNYVIIDKLNPHWTKEHLIRSPAFTYNIFKYVFVASIPFNIKLFAYWTNEQKKAQRNESEKMQAELNFLRNQFHPHFIFNVLNSLYSKILSGSDDAGEIVLKISSLLRFTVYDINNATIPLEKEIGYLRDYIALQQVRFENQVEVSLIVEGSLKDKFIEPFLLIPYIENSFKYCFRESSGEGWVTILISVSDNALTLKVENSLMDMEKMELEKSFKGITNHGVGLINVKKRLELLYPDKHTLKITENQDSYFVWLRLNLLPNGEKI